MACPFCYSSDGPCNVYHKDSRAPLVHIVVPPGFQKCLYVARKHRDLFNDQFLLDDDNDTRIVSLLAKPWNHGGQVFKIHVKRTDDRTTLSGPALHRLMFQYSLEVEDSLTINLKRTKCYHRITVYKDGGKGDEKRPEHGASVIDGQFDDHYAKAKFTDSVQLDQHQDQMLAEFLYNFLVLEGPSYVPLFVHKLTTTNIISKELKLGKDVFQGLALARTGTVNIHMNLQAPQEFCQCSYSIAKVGRMTIRSGWDVFIANNGLIVVMTVVMAFKMLPGVLHMFLNILEYNE